MQNDEKTISDYRNMFWVATLVGWMERLQPRRTLGLSD